MENQLEDILDIDETFKRKFHINCFPCSIRNLLTYYFDIHATVKQHHLKIIYSYTSEQKEKNFLSELVNDRKLYIEAIEKNQTTLVQLVEEFKSIKVYVF